MGRSVSTPTNALLTCYRTLHRADRAVCSICDEEREPHEMTECCGQQLEFHYCIDEDAVGDLIEDLIDTCTNHWPSFYKIDEWLDREDHAWLENGLVKVGVSEYCGLVAIWIVPQEGQESLAERWVNQINDQFVKYFGQLQPVATASNGETFYQQLEH